MRSVTFSVLLLPNASERESESEREKLRMNKALGWMNGPLRYSALSEIAALLRNYIPSF